MPRIFYIMKVEVVQINPIWYYGPSVTNENEIIKDKCEEFKVMWEFVLPPLYH